MTDGNDSGYQYHKYWKEFVEISSFEDYIDRFAFLLQNQVQVHWSTHNLSPQQSIANYPQMFSFQQYNLEEVTALLLL